MADKDGDGIVMKEEFTAFLHPEEFDYMKGVVVQVMSPIEKRYHSDHNLFITDISEANREHVVVVL